MHNLELLLSHLSYCDCPYPCSLFLWATKIFLPKFNCHLWCQVQSSFWRKAVKNKKFTKNSPFFQGFIPLQCLPAFKNSVPSSSFGFFFNEESTVIFRRVNSIEATQQLLDRKPTGLILSFARAGLFFFFKFCPRENVLVQKFSLLLLTYGLSRVSSLSFLSRHSIFQLFLP